MLLLLGSFYLDLKQHRIVYIQILKGFWDLSMSEHPSSFILLCGNKQYFLNPSCFFREMCTFFKPHHFTCLNRNKGLLWLLYGGKLINVGHLKSNYEASASVFVSAFYVSAEVFHNMHRDLDHGKMRIFEKKYLLPSYLFHLNNTWADPKCCKAMGLFKKCPDVLSEVLWCSIEHLSLFCLCGSGICWPLS